MRKPISTATHGVIDYLTAGALFALPSLLGFSPRLSKAVRMIGLKKLAVAAATQHEMGIVKLIPMKHHLAIDVATGATLCALPYMLEDEDDPETACAALVAMGLMEIAYVPLTDTQPREDTVIPDVGQKVRRSLKRTTRSARQMAQV
ncbi:MAG TPA: hypothetical protein VGR35_13615 [Tepidisphaeraceae bacterium]|nr:hypothetical protein [Tepidisphaeraceae bacterium]